tara:strand:- start:39065 stop:39865 length:801 start_codon:yes stop_codon:yes gene_type:complete
MLFRNELKFLKRLVVKVGSNVITNTDGSYDLPKLEGLVKDIYELRSAGVEVLLVSSGAVNVGRPFLRQNPKESIEYRQAASSIGQPKLMQKYCELFQASGISCSQVLLTHDDFKSSTRRVNAINTIEVLFDNNIVPILNENDTVSYEEIALGDNDQLASKAAIMLKAQALLIITSTDGLYDKHPGNPEAKFIKEVSLGHNLSSFEMDQIDPVGTGGMQSKVEAMLEATRYGITGIISSKDLVPMILTPLSEERGTLFTPSKTEVPS